MKIVRSAGVSSLVLVLAALGCADPGKSHLPAGDEPGLRPAVVKPGAGGNNGLEADIYHAHVLELIDAANQAIVDEEDPESGAVGKPLLETGLLDSPEGVTVFGYAVKCALADQVVVAHGADTFEGNGYLTTTTGWREQPLSAAARDDLLACMIAHVNSTVGVDILLSGPAVDGTTDGDFDVEEAVWHVELSSSGHPEHHVWPLSDFAADCDSDPWAALAERICGQDPEGCNFVPRYDLETACVEDPQSNGYVCDGQPVLKTTLKSADVEVLHPSCAPPPQ